MSQYCSKRNDKEIIYDQSNTCDYYEPLENAPSWVNKPKSVHHSASDQLHKVTEQRDRLAEALERILEYQGRFAEEEPKSIAEEALQCLTTNANVDAPAHE